MRPKPAPQGDVKRAWTFRLSFSRTWNVVLVLLLALADRVVDIRRGARRKQPRGRGTYPLAFGLIGIRIRPTVGQEALLGEDLVQAVDDQGGVIALQRIGVLSFVVGAKDAAYDLACDPIVAAAFVVVLVPLPPLRAQASVLFGRHLQDRIVRQPNAGKAAAVFIKTLEQGNSFALQSGEFIACPGGEMQGKLSFGRSGCRYCGYWPDCAAT